MFERCLGILTVLLAFAGEIHAAKIQTTPIAVPQVAAEAILLNQRLQSFRDRLLSSQTLSAFEGETTGLEKTIKEKTTQTEKSIQARTTLNELQQSSLDLQNIRKQVENLSGILTRHATSLEQDLQALKSDADRWDQTNQAIKIQKSPPELLAITSQAVGDIKAAMDYAEEQRKRVAALQQLVATESSIVSTEIEHLKKAMDESQRSLFRRDSLPLWKVQFGRQAETGSHVLQVTYADDLRRLKAFLSAHRLGLALVMAVTIVGLLVFMRMRRPDRATSSPSIPPSIPQRPVALAMLIFIVGMIPLLHRAPNVATGLVSLIATIPVIRLLKPRLAKTHQRMLVTLIVSAVSSHFIRSLQVATWIKRDLFALFDLVVIGIFAALLYQLHRDLARPQRGRLTEVATYFGIIVLFLSLLANLFGYVGLSDLLAQALLSSAYRGVIYYTLALAGSLFIAIVLRDATAQQSAAVDSDRGWLTRRLRFAMRVILLFVWIHTTLNLFAIKTEVYSAIRAVLTYPIDIGSVRFSAGNVVAFVLTLGIGYLIASLTRAVLSEEVLPRLKLPFGLPNAIATVTHYVVLVLVFLLAIAAAGVELSKFTILTGALGVGLGFGLQNVVNNFVSGLILLFERPVRVGDVLEIGNRSGKVRKIGVRSSTLHTPDGSDLIVPNATLISEQVVNWTLTQTRRQIHLNIPIAYGNDPTVVRDLLRTTVSTQSGVLSLPSPAVLFLGFGDSALNFEVRFWAPHPDGVPELKSDVALAIAAALSKAGIRIPVPERTLHLAAQDPDEGLKRLAG